VGVVVGGEGVGGSLVGVDEGAVGVWVRLGVDVLVDGEILVGMGVALT